MSITPPVFNLTASNIGFDSDEDLQTELAKTGGKYFDAPGNVDLVISAAGFHPDKDTGDIYCKGDKTWINVKISLASSDGKSIDHWLQVPTSSLLFGEKATLTVFRKFQQFIFGIGESASINTLQKLLEKYFKDPGKLVGQKVNVDLGYERDYVASADDGTFVIMVKGKPLQEDGADVKLPDRSSAVQHAKSMGIDPGFLRVLKFTPRKSIKVAKVAASDW